MTRGRRLIETIDDKEPTTPADRWVVAGHSAAKVDGRAFVTGEHRYASDVKRPGMLRGKVLRAPKFGAKFASLDASAAEAIPGVTLVHDGDFVGVIAPDETTALRALDALKPSWTEAKESQPNDRDIFSYLKSHVEGDGGRGRGGYEAGSIEQGMAAAGLKMEATYNVAYIAHAPLETRAAVAEWEGDRLTVWTGTQRPFGVRHRAGQCVQAAGGIGPRDRA